MLSECKIRLTISYVIDSSNDIFEPITSVYSSVTLNPIFLSDAHAIDYTNMFMCFAARYFTKIRSVNFLLNFLWEMISRSFIIFLLIGKHIMRALYENCKKENYEVLQ